MYIVSSDGCMDIFPNNAPGDFKIMLKDPIEFLPDEDWELALIDLHYPYSWYNISSDMSLMYADGADVHTITFPDWQCTKATEFIEYISKELKAVANDHYKVGLDQQGRFSMECNRPSCDVGFSTRLIKFLGLSEYDPSYTLSTMQKRATHRRILADFWKNGDNPVEKDTALFSKEWGSMDDSTLLADLKIHLDLDRFQTLTTYEDMTEMATEVDSRVLQVLGVSNTERSRRNINVFLGNFKELYLMTDFPARIIQGDRPLRMNPTQQLHIFTNIIQPVDMNDTVTNLMKVVNVKGVPGAMAQEVYVRPTYQPLQKGGKISLIHVYIRNEEGLPVPFVDGRVLMTLQFRKQRYRR